MSHFDLANLEHISPETRNRFAADFVAMLSDVIHIAYLQKAIDNECIRMCLKKPEKKMDKGDHVKLLSNIVYLGLCGPVCWNFYGFLEYCWCSCFSAFRK